MPILIADEQEAIKLPHARLKRLAQRVLKGEKMWPATLSIAFVDNAVMRKVNRKFLRHDYVTDVLAFFLSDNPIFGEIVVSTDYATGEAAKRGIPVLEEISRYVVHGILHLAGYDDHSPAKKKVMWKRQEAYVRFR